MTDLLAAELRGIIQDAVDTDAHPGIRERLERLAEHVEQADAEPTVRKRVRELTERMHHLEQAATEVDASTELTATFGLEPEQEIRARALDVASYVIGDASGTVNGVAQHLIDLAEPLVGWIRTGERPQ